MSSSCVLSLCRLKFCIVFAFTISLLTIFSLGASDAAEPTHRAPSKTLTSFFARYCNDCHAGGASEGGFNLDALGSNLADAPTFARWQRIFDRVSLGEMPPKDFEPVSKEHLSAFSRLLLLPLDQASNAVKGTVYRRLNRREYQNTMNDLFGIDLELENQLPEDGRLGEFDNVGAALGLSMVHLQQYMNAADSAMEAALATSIEPPEVKTVTASYATADGSERHIGKFWKRLPDDAIVFFQRMNYPTGLLRETNVRPAGRYRVRITGYAYQSDVPITFEVGGASFARGSEKPIYGYFELPPGKPSTVEFEAKIDDRYMIQIEPWGIDAGGYQLSKQDLNKYQGPGLAIQKVELTGPIIDEFPSPGHHLLTGDFERDLVHPEKSYRKAEYKLISSAPERDAEGVLRNVAERAFRRPVQEGELEPYLNLLKHHLDRGQTLDLSLRTAVAAILCSPDFLFLSEPDGSLNDFALASRLSYFLTRTLPDEDLMSAARSGQLTTDASALLTHTQRLLNDPRHERFIVDFCDAWLNLREIEATSPDQTLFPEYDVFLQESLLEETRRFVKKLIAEDLPVHNLVRSDFAILNNRLAKHYGIKGINGPHYRVVDLPKQSLRGGLLSQGSVLKVSANGTNTSPVVRGVWVMDRILGEPPQPPPPGVPGVEPDVRGASTLRELLERHRDLDSCRSCHRVIDPPGFALECFNPIGGYRDRFRSLGEGEKVELEFKGRKVRYKLGQAVDSSGKLSDGTSFSGFAEFRDLLVKDKKQLARALTTKLLTFGTGREMVFSDRALIDEIVSKAQSSDYGVRSLIESIVSSEAFRTK